MNRIVENGEPGCPAGGGSVRRISPLFPDFSRFSGGQLLVSLFLLILAYPFINHYRGGDLMESILLSLVMLAALRVVGGRRRVRLLSVLLLVLALAGNWVAHLHPGAFPRADTIPVALFLIFSVARLLRFVLRAPTVDSRVLCAGLSGYLILGITWMPLYVLTARLQPEAFSFAANASAGMEGFNAFYFSFVTLCTVGYGDVLPVSNVARMLVVLEAVSGMFYVAVILSRLVALYSVSQNVVADSHKQTDPINKEKT